MTRASKKSVKASEGLTSHLFSIKRESQKASKKQLHKLSRKSHKLHLRDAILGPNRTLHATIHVNALKAYEQDTQRLAPLLFSLTSGHTLVYFFDASVGTEGPHRGIISTGLIQYTTDSYLLLPPTSLRSPSPPYDAELLALSLALSHVRQTIQQQGYESKCERIVIYSDCTFVLRGLAEGTLTALGPRVEGKTALEGLYEGCEWLADQGVSVEIEWVKGHAGSVGNKLADAMADRGVIEYVQHREVRFSKIRKENRGEDEEGLPFVTLPSDQTSSITVPQPNTTAIIPSNPPVLLGCQSTTYMGSATESSTLQNPIQAFWNTVSAATHLELQMKIIQSNIAARAARIKQVKKAGPTMGYEDAEVEALLRHLQQEQNEAQMRLWKKSQEKWLHDYLAKGRNLSLCPVAPGTAYVVQDANKGCWVRPGPRGFEVTCISDVEAEAENGKMGYTTITEGEWVGDLLLSALR